MNKVSKKAILYIRECKARRDAIKLKLEEIPSTAFLAKYYGLNESTVKRIENRIYYKL